MAADRNDDNKTFSEHRGTYSSFLTLLKWATLFIAIVLIAMAVFLV